MFQSPSQISILIIEDSPDDEFLLRDYLGDTKLSIGRIEVAGTLKKAIQLLQTEKYTVIFLDFFLPDSRGLESVIELAKVNKQIPVIVLSSLSDMELAVKSIAYGAQDFLIKGEYNPAMLDKAVRYSIERKRNLELIEANNERYDVISKATNDLIWDWDLTTDEVKWHGQGLKNYLPAGTPQGHVPADFWVNGLHPSERKKTIVLLKKAILNGNTSWEADNRFLRTDGTYAHVNTRGYTLVDDNQKPVRMIGCLQDITDRKNAEIEARKAKIEAEDARRTQEQFLANMSHEIRTPMNGVIGMTQLLSNTNISAEQKEYIETIQESANNLMVIVNDILDLTKIVAGKIKIDKVEYVFDDVVKNALRINRYTADQKGISLSAEIESGIHQHLSGDHFRLNQILVNLIGNALKFTEAGEVKLKVSKQAEDTATIKLRFDVTDTGIGIEPSKLSSIFERFTQASNVTTRKYGGTGLGLTITKQLIELQGGKIWVESEPGKGSTFSFEMTIDKLINIKPAAATTATAPAAKSNALEKVNILLVEDNLINQKVAGKILSNEGALVEIANHGLEAIEKLREKKYDIILMDVQMPEMDGYTTTDFIRTQFEKPVATIPIIAMTASALKTEKERCLNAGMDDYVSKPFIAAELFEKIRSRLQPAI